jgi:GT2 family glycosyltransferase
MIDHDALATNIDSDGNRQGAASRRPGLGFVVIGRNEGERLRRCLDSLAGNEAAIVYVDSGSDDGSAELARTKGVSVVELDATEAFSAARARNAGYDALVGREPNAHFVQFIDGDCELDGSFAGAALEAFRADSRIGVVTGRCREKHRDSTIYNRMCDLEWSGPVGEIEACGGIFMIRREAFDAVGGFDPSIIAAEDDDLCLRVRAQGFRVVRIDAAMCEHDAAMTRFSQWWRRAVRAGYAFAQVGERHRGYFRRERLRVAFWAFVLPLMVLMLAPLTRGWSLLALALYPLSYFRTRANLVRTGATPRDAGLYAAFLMLSKAPNLIGMLTYWRDRSMGRAGPIIEYKR